MNFSISETQLRNLISGYMKVKEDDVQDIYQIRKGMTNQSYHFCVDNREYLLRIPGKGTQKIIDRRKEAEIVAQLQDLDICDEVVVIDPESGILIKAYYPDSRTADDHNREDLALCMQKLKQLHRLHLTSSFRFELFEEIKRYEELTGVSEFPKEMQLLREKIFSFQPFIEAHTYTRCLCHIDAVKDNFLLHDGKVHLIDWEYAGDADPHLDLAMFSVYSNYSPKELNQLISLYMEGPFPEYIAAKIYGYASACALLWYYWCIIREKSGVRFDEYKRQDRQGEDMNFWFRASFCGIIAQRKASQASPGIPFIRMAQAPHFFCIQLHSQRIKSASSPFMSLSGSRLFSSFNTAATVMPPFSYSYSKDCI